MELKYGRNSIEFSVSEKNLLGILETKGIPVESLDALLKNSIMSPIGKPRLRELFRKNRPQDLVIIVSDITRSIADYSKILEFLVSEIVDAGVDEKNIEFLVALGTHKKHTAEANKFLYGDLISKFKFSFHDCYDNCVLIGKTNTGLEVQVNKRVRAADFVIATGKINFHYLAGFSGGRKSILPGISSYQSIRANHCKLRRDSVTIGKIKNNIIAQEMEEAAKLFGVDYLLNVVETPTKKTCRIFCGHHEYAFNEGVKFFKSLRLINISKLADCAVVSAHGYPDDKNFFMSHKALNTVLSAIRQNGSIILVAQCSEGIGNEKFSEYMQENSIDELLKYSEERIEVGGHRAFVTAKILRDYNVFVLSDLDSKKISQLHFRSIDSLDEGIKQVKKFYGGEFQTYIVPEGQAILPVLNKKSVI
jgi:nickel-dependent lactate racemase